MSRKNSINFLFYALPPIIYAGLIFFLSSLPSERITFVSGIKDYILHFFEFGLLALLTIRFVNFYFDPGVRCYFLIFLATMLYGLSDEWHQSFVPGRVASVSDLLADTLGVIFGLGIYYAVIRYKERGRGKTLPGV
jgi:VanZ family protein